MVADPVVKNGRTLLGIRDLANGLNADVQWDGARKEVKLTTKPVEQYPNYDKLLKYIEEYRKAVGEQTDKQKEQQEQQKQEKVDVTNESSYAEQMLRLVNEEREKVGVSPLELDSTLTAAAQIRAKEIIEVFDHTRPNDWKVSRVGNFFSFSSGDSLTNEDIRDDGMYLVYGANGIRGYAYRLSAISEFVSRFCLSGGGCHFTAAGTDADYI